MSAAVIPFATWRTSRQTEQQQSLLFPGVRTADLQAELNHVRLSAIERDGSSNPQLVPNELLQTSSRKVHLKRRG